MIAALVAEFLPWLIGAAGVLGAFVVAYFKGRGDGKSLERSKTAEQNAKAAQTRKDVDDDVVKMDDDQLNSNYDRWVRRNGKR